jgi:diadenosine tetraphosphate (Ap4A) HIT family hydrolase
MDGCFMCDRDNLRHAEVYFENDHCVYASTRDPRDPPDVLPGSGIAIPIAHRSSPFDFTPAEWAALREVLVKAKESWDARLAPDGYFLSWSCFVPSDDAVRTMHAHLHVVPRFDDEPYRDRGGRTAIKEPANTRPDPWRPGSGRAKLFGRWNDPPRPAVGQTTS